MTPHIFVSINIIGVRLVTSTQAGVRTDTVGLHDGTFHIKKMTDNEFHKETLLRITRICFLSLKHLLKDVGVRVRQDVSIMFLLGRLKMKL